MVRSLLVTACDSGFFAYLEDAVESLAVNGALLKSDLVIIDLGLAEESRIKMIRNYGAVVVQPDWPGYVPFAHRNIKQLGLAVRPLIRDYFTGYEVYIWFDADAWIQEGSVIDRYIEGAIKSGVAVVKEDGPGYHKSILEKRWWFGNHILAYGIVNGTRLCAMPSINIGILALYNNAPHWDAWSMYYEKAISRTDKVNLDQHAFVAAMYLERLDASYLYATDNWLPILSAPMWDSERLHLVTPDRNQRIIGIIHLAGPNKDRKYRLIDKDGIIETSLTYRAIQTLSAGA